ncbi:DUF5916 domain-containing protein [Tenacibaculum maritimum]|uniref:DUF5916 domain-containing protein n=1 Tax=Tenacibaculum maritimum TaxID=107401 RepID=UPI0012E613F5|nr:DUF5916 domain-containing protein [Tenacibaculum maritimum]CAA0149384.1 Protein of unknown function precursor containing a CBM9 [Tenacibaculum maritimum]
MHFKTLLAVPLLLLYGSYSFSQINLHRKKTTIKRTKTPPKIDGILNDVAWEDAEILTHFSMVRPDNGKPAPSTHKTTATLVYDDNAIYVSAFMYDNNPSSIPMEFTNRDVIGNTDLFAITINPNDDGQNAFQFIVQSTGGQADATIANGREDFNWSAVWDSKVAVTDKGWAVELKIPYNALRFANQPVQNWGVNLHRRIQSLNARYTWNPIDNTTGRWSQYDGLVVGLTNIHPPTRLNFYPYASTSVQTSNTESITDWAVGMDVKYGITENITLDASLIPDFSQTAFDNVTLNLGPFEQQFSEQRQFFIEGTDLFSKGNLFYSRRIGGKPIDQFPVSNQLHSEETIVEKPTKVNMLNAIKISGRTPKGLGIGMLNAITEKTTAEIRNNTTQSTREVVINPLSNYNIFVLDQQFNKNSSVSLVNTNVIRNGAFRDANVTGLLYHIEDKASKYHLDGAVKMSAISDDIDARSPGYALDAKIGKHSGNWRGNLGYSFENNNYDPNDMGILRSNNKQRIYGFVGYRLLKPKGIFNRLGTNLSYAIHYLHQPATYTGTRGGLSFWAQTKKRFDFGADLNYNTKQKDFFEPRQGTTSGVFFERPERIHIRHWGSSDYRKKMAIDYRFYRTFFNNHPKNNYGFFISPRYRFNNRFSLLYGLRFHKVNNDQGYVTTITADDVAENADVTPFLNAIVFGQRDRFTYNNSLSGKYSFSVTSSLALTFRHNWSKVPYQNAFFKLAADGQLTPIAYTGTHDINFNNWNLDLNYQWQFAPGSQLILFYRNSISNSNSNATQSFQENLTELLRATHQHTFSLRLVYFIDYNTLKNLL